MFTFRSQMRITHTKGTQYNYAHSKIKFLFILFSLPRRSHGAIRGFFILQSAIQSKSRHRSFCTGCFLFAERMNILIALTSFNYLYRIKIRLSRRVVKRIELFSLFDFSPYCAESSSAFGNGVSADA